MIINVEVPENIADRLPVQKGKVISYEQLVTFYRFENQENEIAKKMDKIDSKGNYQPLEDPQEMLKW